MKRVTDYESLEAHGTSIELLRAQKELADMYDPYFDFADNAIGKECRPVLPSRIEVKEKGRQAGCKNYTPSPITTNRNSRFAKLDIPVLNHKNSERIPGLKTMLTYQEEEVEAKTEVTEKTLNEVYQNELSKN